MMKGTIRFGKMMVLAFGLVGHSAFAAPPVPPSQSHALMPEEPPASLGSLWSEADVRVLIGMDGNARRVGDLITVIITEQTQMEVTADTQTKRDSSTGGGITSLFGIGKGITGANGNMGGEIGIEVEGSAEYRGDAKTRREGSLEGRLTCRVIEVMANGNLVVWGWKEVTANRENQYLVLTGTVRPRDIQADNTVQSELLAEAKIEFSGQGVVADKQGPGMGHRIIDRAWPF